MGTVQMGKYIQRKRCTSRHVQIFSSHDGFFVLSVRIKGHKLAVPQFFLSKKAPRPFSDQQFGVRGGGYVLPNVE